MFGNNVACSLHNLLITWLLCVTGRKNHRPTGDMVFRPSVRRQQRLHNVAEAQQESKCTSLGRRVYFKALLFGNPSQLLFTVIHRAHTASAISKRCCIELLHHKCRLSYL